MGYKLKWESRHIYAIIIGVLMLVVALVFLREKPYFIPWIVLSMTMAWSQHWVDFFVKTKMDKELEEKFPEFVRNLVSGVKSGMPIGRAINQVAKNDYGALNNHVQKLSNQVEWAIPIHKALYNFSNDTNNDVIKRAIATVIEAEQSGGNIEDVLESITNSVIDIKKIKQERKASIQGQIVQSYIIFIVFLGVMVTIQNLLIPYVAGISAGGGEGSEIALGGQDTAAMDALMQKAEIDFSTLGGFLRSMGVWFVSIRGVFLMLAIIQGLFAGLVLGELAEGDIRSGFKHSLILVTLAVLIITLAQGSMTLPTTGGAEAIAAGVSGLAA